MFWADICSSVSLGAISYAGQNHQRLSHYQGSSVVSEQTISSGGHTDHKTHNQLPTEVFKALQMLKSCYKDGLIKVIEEDSTHEPKPFVYKND